MSTFGDLLYDLSQYLRTTPALDLADRIAATSLSRAISSNFWAVPALQVAHILAIAAAFGSVLMINMRILRISGVDRTMGDTVARFAPWIWWALLVLVISGLGMIIAEPTRELLNAAFWIKMVLVISMIGVTLAFQARTVRLNVKDWEATHARRTSVRLTSAAILLLWCAIIFAGRWIAYAPT